MSIKEIDVLGKKYISLKQASEISGYTNDYIGQLCRAGKLNSERVGRAWFVDIEQLLSYKNGKKNNGITHGVKKNEPQIEVEDKKIIEQNVDLEKLQGDVDSWEKEILGLDEKSNKKLFSRLQG